MYLLIGIAMTIASAMTARKVATYYMKIMDSYTTKIIKVIEDLIAQTVGKDKN